jgi:hypothetical protein
VQEWRGQIATFGFLTSVGEAWLENGIARLRCIFRSKDVII